MKKIFLAILAVMLTTVGASAAAGHTVKLLNAVDNGTFSVGENAVTTDGTTFTGATLTLTALPAEGYRLQSVTYQAYVTGGQLQAPRRIAAGPGVNEEVTLTFADEDFTYSPATGKYSIAIATDKNILIREAVFVEKTDLSSATLTLTPNVFVYSGAVQKPAVTVKLGETTLVDGTDYMLGWPDASYSDVGYHNVTVQTDSTAAATFGTSEPFRFIAEAYKGSLSDSYAIAGEIGRDILGALADPNAVYTYDGLAHKPAVKFTVGGQDFEMAEDGYTIEYKDSVLAGVNTGKIVLKGVAPYTGEQIVPFTIQPMDISSLANERFVIADQVYNGRAQQPAVSIKAATAEGEEERLIPYYDDDLLITYRENTNAGTAQVTIVGKSMIFDGSIRNFAGTKTGLTFDITPYKLDITTKDQTIVYGDTVATADTLYTVGTLMNGHTISGVKLEGSTDQVTTEGKVTVAQYAIKDMDGTNVSANYELNTEVYGTLVINPKDLKDEFTIEGIDSAYNYTAQPIMPVVTIKDGETVLDGETDYDVVYADTLMAGTAKATVTLKGNYKGAKTQTYEISKLPLTVKANDQTITYSYNISTALDQITVTGLAEGDAVTAVTLAPTTSTVGTDTIKASAVKVEHEDAIADRTANYVVTYEVGYMTVQPKDASNFAVSGIETNYTYTGTAIKPVVTVKDGETVLKDTTDYRVVYTDSINAGTATVTINFHGNYKNQIVKNFTIDQKALTVAATAQVIEYSDDIDSLVTVTGLIEGDSVMNITLTPSTTAMTTTSTITPAGAKVITPAVAATETTPAVAEKDVTANYAITYTQGNLTIKALPLDRVTIEGVKDTLLYNYGAPVEQTTLVMKNLKGVELVENTDFVLNYTNNIEVGHAVMTISTPEGANYVGDSIVKFEVVINEIITENATIVLSLDENNERVGDVVTVENKKKVTIPETVVGEDGNTYPVTVISAGAFEDATDVKHIYLPSKTSVLTIEDPTFDGLAAAEGGAKVHVYQTLLDEYAETELQSLVDLGLLVTDVQNVNHYFTFSNKQNVILPNGVSQYVCKIIDGNVHIFKTEGRIVAANTGVLLDATVKNHELVATNEAATADYTDNALVAVTDKTHITDYSHAFLLKDNEFWKMNGNSAVPDGKAYLWIEDESAAPARMAIVIGGEATGIHSVGRVDNATDGTVYTLSGQKVNKVQKGIYVINGKKVMVK